MISPDYQQLKCSFCGKPSSDVAKLLEGPGVCICNECIVYGVEFLDNPGRKVQTTNPKPVEIKNFLDEYIIGQDRAKKALAVAVYNHYKRIQHASSNIQKSNIMLIGPSGSGKTFTVQTLAKFLDVPLAIVDATAMTESGYVGEDVETMLQTLLINANGNEEAAAKGIIYIDEIDKKARKSGANPSITRDVSGEGVQQALLKLIEGTVANVHPVGQRKHPGQQYIRLDTRNILFILGGAFNGLAEIIAEGQNYGSVGFLTEKTSKQGLDKVYLKKVHAKDLVKYGLIPELVGRVPVIVTLDELSIDDLVRVLTEPKHSLIQQYVELLEMDDIALEFENKALHYIAEKAMAEGTGARGLRSIVEEVMLETMFSIPSEEGVMQCSVILENDSLNVVRR